VIIQIISQSKTLIVWHRREINKMMLKTYIKKQLRLILITYPELEAIVTLNALVKIIQIQNNQNI